MPTRIFLKDVAGCKAGQIADYDWAAFQASAAQHHGVTKPLDDYSLPVETAAQLYVASLTASKDKVPREPRGEHTPRRLE